MYTSFRGFLHAERASRQCSHFNRMDLAGSGPFGVYQRHGPAILLILHCPLGSNIQLIQKPGKSVKKPVRMKGGDVLHYRSAKSDKSSSKPFAMTKTIRSVNTYKDGESKSFLQQFFGIDKWCTVYEEDEGFRLLADLSLCMYFGCGKKRGTEDEPEVPIVVSVASEDYDWSDTVSDICEDRHRSSAKLEETTAGSRKPDPPSSRSDANTVTGIHSPPRPTSIDSPSTEKKKNLDESSRVAAHYESRETLEDIDAAHIPPPSTVIIKNKRRSKRPPLHQREEIPVYDESFEINHRYQAEKCLEDEYPIDEYPLIVYSETLSALFGYV